ncbi:alpha/beta hydrolase [Lapillicoccus jejuensis]|uniref:Acetyl esterase n=1 Tax=Lapillicoccus jejuensis TaxID=402171 RepID=A0A542E4U8_9MICO|nr:alpha/beta hydrolase [Lapillicoccus jejuensis]TQJ10309.1 acetyl esterase [Lapillicoccus jejuensis]
MARSRSSRYPMPLSTRLLTGLLDRTGGLDVGAMSQEEIVAQRRRVPPAVPPVTWVTGAVPRGVRLGWATARARDGHPLSVRTYAPADARGPVPVLVYLHGGGWVLGNVRGYDALCAHLAAQVGALVLNVDYRMAPEHKAPRAAQDSVDALRWAAEAAGSLGGDPDRLAVGGDSAGGNLSAVACQVLRDEGGPTIALQALLYPGVDARQTFPSVREKADAPVLTTRQIDAFLAAYVDDSGLTRDDPLVSPYYADLAGLPPALVQTAEHDPLRDEGEAYGAALAAAGVPVRTTRYVGVPHGFHSFPGATRVGAQARAELVTELRRALHPTQQPTQQPAGP